MLKNYLLIQVNCEAFVVYSINKSFLAEDVFKRKTPSSFNDNFKTENIQEQKHVIT